MRKILADSPAHFVLLDALPLSFGRSRAVPAHNPPKIAIAGTPHYQTVGLNIEVSRPIVDAMLIQAASQVLISWWGLLRRGFTPRCGNFDVPTNYSLLAIWWQIDNYGRPVWLRIGFVAPRWIDVGSFQIVRRVISFGRIFVQLQFEYPEWQHDLY
jgi:hypothetical protein